MQTVQECRQRKIGCLRDGTTTVGAWLVLLGLWLTAGCQPSANPNKAPQLGPGESKAAVEQSGKLRVVASQAFLADAVTALGGERVELLFLVPPGGDPATWKPTAQDLQTMQGADLIILNGASYEPWVASVALPATRMVRTANSFREKWIETDAVVHTHGPGGEHSHPGTASTTWLDLEQAMAQVTAVRNRLVEELPASESEEVDRRHAAYNAELQEMHSRMQQLAEELKGQPIIVSHPVYQYWQRKYELNLRSLDWEPTESPDESGWAELDSALKDFPAKLFVWESTPSAENEAALAARGFTSLVFAPAANLPRGSSWRTEMRANLERLQKVVEKVR